MKDHPRARNFRFTGMVASLSDRRVGIRFQGQTVWSQQLAAHEAVPLDLRLFARPGRNYLHFTSERQPEPLPGPPHAIRVAQGIVGLRIVRDPPTPP